MNDRPRLGAYVLAADPAWLKSSLTRYYPLIDSLVVSIPEDGLGWTGSPVPAIDCLELVREVDTRNIARVVTGIFSGYPSPAEADTAQRRSALAAVDQSVDWVLQIDTDEVLPDPGKLLDAMRTAEELDLHAVEWPMRVLYRAAGYGRYIEVVAADGSPRYDYPGPIAVRPGVELVDCRRASCSFLRPIVEGDSHSLQITRPAADGEVRRSILSSDDAIWHNSWARSPKQVHRKVSSWTHNEGLRTTLYYWTTWLPSRWTWRYARDVHPFARGLWPRLAPAERDIASMLDPGER